MIARLDEVFNLQMGKTPSRNNTDYWINGQYDWISIADLGGYQKYVEKTKEKISALAVQESGIKSVPANTVIMSFKLSLGKTAITKNPVYTNEAIMAFIPTGRYAVLPDYFYYLFSARDWTKGTNRAVMGTTLNKATLSALSIEVHPLEKQHHIAATLDKVSDLISKRRQQLDKLDELVKARFVEMFGDLADPKCQYARCKLVGACVDPDDIKCGPFGTQLSKDEYQESGVAVWEIPQINSGFKEYPTHFLTAEKARQLSAYSLIPGDIAMSRKGNVGRCGLYPKTFKPGIIHSDVLRIRVDSNRVDPCFMMYQLHFSRAVERQIEMVSSGAIMAGINVTKLKHIYVHIPPVNLQRQFTYFVDQTENIKTTISRSLEKLETLKKALMQEYFGT